MKPAKSKINPWFVGDKFWWSEFNSDGQNVILKNRYWRVITCCHIRMMGSHFYGTSAQQSHKTSLTMVEPPLCWLLPQRLWQINFTDNLVNDAIDIALWSSDGGVIIDWARRRLVYNCWLSTYCDRPNKHKIKKENQTIEMNNAVAAIKAIVPAV
jgi:hypothetical protein